MTWDGKERRKVPSVCPSDINASLAEIKLTLARMEVDVENRHAYNISTLAEIKAAAMKVSSILYGNGAVGIIGKVEKLEDQHKSMVLWFRIIGGGIITLIIKKLWGTIRIR